MMNWIRTLVVAGFALSALVLVGVSTAAESPDVQAQAPPRPTAQHRPGLDERMQLLTAELGLDEKQQSAVRALLLDQREQVMKVWSDPAVPPAFRISATQAISGRTADRIRALLNDEQKTKYVTARKLREAQSDASKLTVEDWMSATSRK